MRCTVTATVNDIMQRAQQQQVEFISFTGDYKTLLRNSWNKWDVIASLGVVAACAAFYIYFW